MRLLCPSGQPEKGLTGPDLARPEERGESSTGSVCDGIDLFTAVLSSYQAICTYIQYSSVFMYIDSHINSQR
jgi:hypothetical protein